jgi:hypothetical protein
MNASDAVQDQKNKQTWHCFKCEELVPDADADGKGVAVMAMQRACPY